MNLAHNAIVATSISCVALLGVFTPTVGEFVQRQVAPFTSERTLDSWERTDRAICWTWHFMKYREGTAKFWDYHLVDSMGHNTVFVPYVSLTGPNPDGVPRGFPPENGAPIPHGANTSSLCVDLPHWVRPDEEVAIYGEIGYPGWFNAWTVWVRMPDMTFPPKRQ